MTIVQLIAAKAAILNMTFVHGLKAWQNLDDEKAELDGFIYLDEPIKSNDTLHQTGYIEPEFPLVILFLKKINLDADPDQQQDVITPMRVKARQMIIELQGEDALVREVKDATRTDVMNVMDLNLTGTMLEITIVPRNTDSVCII